MPWGDVDDVGPVARMATSRETDPECDQQDYQRLTLDLGFPRRLDGRAVMSVPWGRRTMGGVGKG